MIDKIVAQERAWFDDNLTDWQELRIALGVSLPEKQKPRTIVEAEIVAGWGIVTLDTGQVFLMVPGSISESREAVIAGPLKERMEHDDNVAEGEWTGGYLAAKRKLKQ